jgi:hypothetical protein
MSFWTPVENPGMRPLRSWVFGIVCTLLAALDRLVQEALTNTMKHAGPGASAAVRLRLAPGEVRIDIAAAIDCLLCCGLPVGPHCFVAQQIHRPVVPSRLGKALRERMPILSKTCPRWNSTALTVT